MSSYALIYSLVSAMLCIHCVYLRKRKHCLVLDIRQKVAFTSDVLLFLRKLIFWKKLCSAFQLWWHSSHAILPRTGILWGAHVKMLVGMAYKCHLLKAINQIFFTYAEKEQGKTAIQPIVDNITTMYYFNKPENSPSPNLPLRHSGKYIFHPACTLKTNRNKTKNASPQGQSVQIMTGNTNAFLYTNRERVGKLFLIMPNSSLAMI